MQKDGREREVECRAFPGLAGAGRPGRLADRLLRCVLDRVGRAVDCECSLQGHTQVVDSPIRTIIHRRNRADRSLLLAIRSKLLHTTELRVEELVQASLQLSVLESE